MLLLLLLLLDNYSPPSQIVNAVQMELTMAALRVMLMETVENVLLAVLGKSVATVSNTFVSTLSVLDTNGFPACTCCGEGTVSGSNQCDDQGRCECATGFSDEGCCTNSKCVAH